MANPNKQAQLKAKQDTLRDEVNLFLVAGKRAQAVEHYQKKCGCSAERAAAFVESLDQERRDRLRNVILSRMRNRRF